MPRMIAERADVVPALAEIFRLHGYAGASLSIITEATGLGKGSLYNFFPGGKPEMLDAVLIEIEEWFENNIFAQMRHNEDPVDAILTMLDEVSLYFNSGRRVCLVGALALTDPDDRFGAAVNRYFTTWRKELTRALKRAGVTAPRDHAVDILGRIQGSLILTRALNDPHIFSRAVKSISDQYRNVLTRPQTMPGTITKN